MSKEELLAKVLSLPRRDRATVAGAVLSSLEEPEEAVAAAWGQELELRSREVADGRVRTVAWDQARERISTSLERRRVRRASS